MLILLGYCGGIGRTYRINLSLKWTATMASMRGEPSRPTVLLNGSPAITFHGPGSRPDGLILATTHSGRWLGHIQSSRRCVNYVVRCRRCGFPIFRWERMAATALCCRHSARARAATSRATPSSYLVLAPGFV